MFVRYIVKRYLLSGSKNSAVNIITRISTVGIVVGSMAMFIFLSVFSGLREFSLSFVNDLDPDLKLLPKEGKSFLVSPEMLSSTLQIDGIKAISTVVEERALFTFDGKDHLAYIKGIDSMYGRVTNIEENIISGNWIESGSYHAVIGSGIAKKLSVGLFDFQNLFEVLVAKPGRGTIESVDGAFNKIAVLPVGYYYLNDELSYKYVYTDIDVARELLQFTPNQISSVEIKLSPESSERQVRKAILALYGDEFEIKNRRELNESLHRMLNSENFVLYLISALVLIVIMFTLVGALIMVIIDKKQDLKTLRSMGLELRQLRDIFLYQGVGICMTGGVIGVFLGALIVYLQNKFSLLMITPHLAYPVKFTILNPFIVLLTILVLGYAASYLASRYVKDEKTPD